VSLARRRLGDRAAAAVGLLALLCLLLALAAVFVQLLLDGGARLGLDFIVSMASRDPARAGVLPALVGSALVLLVTALAAVPVGIGAAVYLQEYAPDNRLTDLIEVNIANLAAVPSVLFGLLSLSLLVHGLALGESILAAGLTLAMLVLPLVVVATREALRQVPVGVREASYALGASRWQTVWRHVLPAATPGVLTGVILGLSRAIGETAPLLALGALGFVAFLPPPMLVVEPPFVDGRWLSDPFITLPLQIYDWLLRPDPAFRANAAAAGLLLAGFTLLVNAAAIGLRWRSRNPTRQR